VIRRNYVLVCAFYLGLSGLASAQNSNSGDIRGTVTDSTGALVPGVDVTVTNTDTGVVNHYVTNNDGLYDTNSILPGNYTLEFSKQGFEKFKRDSVPLQVGIVTVNAALNVGSATQEVVVSSQAPLLKTEDSQVSTTLTTTQLDNLPNTDPENGWTYLLKLIPGATSTPMGTNGGGAGDAEPQADQAINGTMPYFASYLVDGGSIWLPHSANINQGQSETVSEVNVIATNAPAQYGGGGAVFNVISKSGANQFHGSLYDNFQNDALNARDYFNSTGSKNRVRYNYLGGSVSGPILKNKMFFFYNYQQLFNPQNSIKKASEPTQAMKAGCFNPALFGTSLTLDARHGGTPLTTNPAQCGNYDSNNGADLALPPADFDPVAVNIQNGYYLNPNLPGLSNNYSYLAPAVNNQTKMFGRFDYNITPTNRLNFSIIEFYAPVEVSYNGSPNCPVNCQNNSSDGGNAQISDVYTISSTMVNEFRFSWNRGADYDAQQSLGQGIPAKLGLQFSTADVFPSVGITGTGAPSNLGPGTEALFIQNTFAPSDTLTWIKGKNILHFGFELLMEEDNSTPWGAVNGATLNFTGQFTTSNPAVDVGYADFLLGDVQAWNTATQPKHYMRAKNPSYFAQDDIKLRSNLTVNLGLRIETHGGASEKYNNAGGFDPTIPNPVPSTPLYPVNANGSIWFAGLNGARTKSFATKTIVLPRLGFAYTPSQNWVFRGGVGQFGTLWSEDTVGGTMGFGSGCGYPNLCGAVGSSSTSSATTPVVQLSGSGANLPIVQGAAARNPLSYITPANPQGSGGTIPYTPYHLPIQNGWQWTGGVQRRLPGNMVAEAQYVGSHWDNMMFEADVNQLPVTKLGQGQTARPYPQFSGIGVGSGGSRTGTYNGISNYQAAQFMLHKPTSHGLAGELSYTWSRLYDDMDDSGWGQQFGAVYYQDAYNPSANYGPSNFNRANVLKGTVIYQVPLGKGHQYFNSTLADTALGGWQAAGAFQAESGVPITVVMNSSIPSGSLGGSDGNNQAALYPNRIGNPHSTKQSLNQWFNQLAYAAPPVNTFGTNPKNSLGGPDLSDFDFSLAKSWGIPGWERGKVQLRMDAQNIFNHPSFENPSNSLNPTALSTGIPDPSVAQVTVTTITGRTVMLTGRFSF
jgi:hypothetical protein